MSLKLLCLVVLGLALHSTSPSASAEQGRAESHRREIARSAEEITPDKGVFLVARTNMRDPRFWGAVILLVKHDRNGTVGLIINRITKIQLSDVLPDLELPSSDTHQLFFGGPVGLGGLFFLARSLEPIEGATRIMEDVYLSGDREILEDLLRHKASDELRLYFGYSGWAPGQLAGEIDHGSWRVLPADTYTVFEKRLDTIWRDLIRHLLPSSIVASIF